MRHPTVVSCGAIALVCVAAIAHAGSGTSDVAAGSGTSDVAAGSGTSDVAAGSGTSDVAAGAGPRVAQADPATDDSSITPFDADGDGDIDADDAAILKAAEQVEIVDKSDGQKLRESARAVTVIDTKQARERTADMGEVLSRTQGIQVRRVGGLGTATRISLNGLYDDQVRFFLDGVPLELAGWGLGFANVPIELVHHIVVHRGVVPIALGADALGGAVDFVTDPSWVNRSSLSYQVGSFGTHRVATTARARDSATGLALGLGMFFDRTKNNYKIDVEVPDEQGRLHPARVRRFHDGYTAAGGSLEAGVVNKGIVKRALARLYTTDYDKELQHNVVMTVPYGEVSYGEAARGVLVDVDLASGPWRGRTVAGAVRRNIDFVDQSTFVYDWYGNKVRERRRPGELGSEPTFQRIRETGVFARLNLERVIDEQHTVRIAVAPTANLRTGTDFLEPNPNGRDPLSAKRDLRQLVTGVEHDMKLFDDRFNNIGFVKHYAMWTDAEDVRPGFVFVPLEQTFQRFGAGDSFRYWLIPQLALKGSYEWTTRLPSVDELFGDGMLIQPNLKLRPETSHNLNLGARFEGENRRGSIAAEGNFFARLTDDMILLLGDDRYFTFQNVLAARTLGVEGSVELATPREWASIEGSFTLTDSRNASSEGTFGAFDGDHLPNRSPLLVALTGTLRKRDLAARGDELSVFADSRYVHEFFRGWESAGLRQFKQVVPSQLVHGAGVTYAVRSNAPIITTIELQNLTNARAYDSFGAQKPGRALYLKVSAEL